MPQPPTLKVAEIFSSIQGEGLRQGEPTLFVRFSGCNLECSFCDTKYAWKKGKDYSTFQIIDKIKKQRRRFPAEWVCLTGGEPLLQDLADLVQKLKEERFKIQVETNATIFCSLPVDWYSISPKPEKYLFRPEYKKAAKEVKLVVTKALNLDTVQRLRQEFPEKTPIFLQPQSTRKWSLDKGMKLLKQAQQAGIKNTRLSAQLHKIYGLR
ncbi:MAG: 4Fe-4S cluster-binding domain-containing protein [Candidatus Aminicenantes bacterium]|nr:4Fe-4S cluster-binding domain-containing protein [Candidatus Aminicenantes bacterium]